MSEIKVHDCVSFLDETGCRRVGDVAVIFNGVADVRVPGFRDVFVVKLAKLTPHAQLGSR